jgi:TPR repeat protein
MRRLWRLFSTRKRVPASAEPFEDGLAAAKRGDYATALKFWRPLAEQEYTGAQYNLGHMFRRGQGVPQDDAEAVKWYRKAAEQGHAEAQSNLGHIYANGLGVPQDFVQAHFWFSLAAAQDDEEAQEALDIVAKRMTPDQIAEAQRLGCEWMAKHQQ